VVCMKCLNHTAIYNEHLLKYIRAVPADYAFEYMPIVMLQQVRRSPKPLTSALNSELLGTLGLLSPENLSFGASCRTPCRRDVERHEGGAVPCL
jgi:hypothetical protein